MKIKLSPERKELLRKRYEGKLIARLNGRQAFDLRNSLGEYCLIGACLTDEEINEYRGDLHPLVHRICPGLSPQRMYRIHDSGSEAVLVQTIEFLLEDCAEI